MKEFMFLVTGIVIGGAVGTALAKSGQANRIIDNLLRERDAQFARAEEERKRQPA